MRLAIAAIAVILLVAIGAIEASVSAAQLAARGTLLRLESFGVLLSTLSFLASAAVYLALGFISRDERAALRTGALAGVAAGILGGIVRAFIIRDAIDAIVSRYAVVPGWFVPSVLGTFAALSCVASAVGGGALAWTGHRLSRAARTRPPA